MSFIAPSLAGYAAEIVDTLLRMALLEDPIYPEPATREPALRHRRVIDWNETRPEIDASQVAVFAASLSDLNALYLAAHDERIVAIASALVAGCLPYVRVNSTERHIEKAVRKTQDDLSMDAEQRAVDCCTRTVAIP